MKKHLIVAAIGLFAFLIFANASFAQSIPTAPETVMVTLHVKPGSEAEMQQVLAQHWKTANELKLVFDSPHLTIHGLEEGNKTYFIDVFTWREASIPDDAPPEIQKLWDEMNKLVESRGEHPGLEFVPVSVVSH